ncbi:MAG: DNA repair exonuclease [Planctomycetota bacterium]
MLRFIHLADVHLDTPFRSRDAELRQALAEAGREAFRRAVTLAVIEKAQAFVIAGDLFDNDRLSFRTEVLLQEQFERLNDSGITVVIATGNHDPGGRDLRAYRRADSWPKSLVLARGKDLVETTILDGNGRALGTIAAIGHATAREAENLVRRFGRPNPKLPSVAVLHTQVESAVAAAKHERYAPCSLEDLRTRSYDYWALGHVHLRQELSKQPAVHYPGNLQGRHFGETGAKGALLVEIDGPGEQPRVFFRDLAPIRWDLLQLNDLSGVESATELIDRAARAYDGMRDHAASVHGYRGDARHLLRIKLIGPCPMAGALNFPEEAKALGELARDELDALHVEWDVSELRAPYDVASLRERSRILDGAFSLLEGLRSGEVSWDELGTGPLASLGASHEVRHRDSLGRDRILSSLEELLAEAMTDEAGP